MRLHIDAQNSVFAANSIPEFFHCSGFALLGRDHPGGNTLLHGARAAGLRRRLEIAGTAPCWSSPSRTGGSRL